MGHSGKLWSNSLSRVKDLTWSIVVTDLVDADADTVVAWWFHPDRWSDYLQLIKDRGALDVTFKQSTTGGLAVRTLTYRDAEGWRVDYRRESVVYEDGIPSRTGDQYSAADKSIVNVLHGRRDLTLHCARRQVFEAIGIGETRISATFEYTMSGGKRRWRRGVRRNDYLSHCAEYNKMIGQFELSHRLLGNSLPFLERGMDPDSDPLA